MSIKSVRMNKTLIYKSNRICNFVMYGLTVGQDVTRGNEICIYQILVSSLAYHVMNIKYVRMNKALI